MALGGVPLACSSVQAQADLTAIEDRIATAFDLVEGNPSTSPFRWRGSRWRAARSQAATKPRRRKASRSRQPSPASRNSPPSSLRLRLTIRPISSRAPPRIRTSRACRVRVRWSRGEQEEASLIGVPLDLVAGAASSIARGAAAASACRRGYRRAGRRAAGHRHAASRRRPFRRRASWSAAGPACRPAKPRTRTAISAATPRRFRPAASASPRRISRSAASPGHPDVASGRPGPLWAVMHDDEDMSFDNAVQALSTYGGTLITVETGGRRNLDGIDPNRNFSADGIGCAKLGDDATPRFTLMFRRPLRSGAADRRAAQQCRPAGVRPAATAMPRWRRCRRDMRASPAADQDGPLAGEHTLVLLAATSADDRRRGIDDDRAERAGDQRAARDRCAPARGDCSLSNYSVLSGHTDYLNVTVDQDEARSSARSSTSSWPAEPRPPSPRNKAGR